MTAPDMTSLVAPLVWDNAHTEGVTRYADTPFGSYSIIDHGPKRQSERFVVRFHNLVLSFHGQSELAELAAQANYAARIIAALDPAALAAMLAAAEQRGREAERAGICADLAMNAYIDNAKTLAQVSHNVGVDTAVAAIRARANLPDVAKEVGE